jgi:hypothetical protein
MTRLVISNTELDFQGALLKALTTHSDMENSLIKRMSSVFGFKFLCDDTLGRGVSGPRLLAGK